MMKNYDTDFCRFKGTVYHTYLYWDAESNEALDNIRMNERYDKAVKEKRHLIPCEPLLMVEVWDNRGDDGHVEYRLYGWRFVNTSTLTNDMNTVKECSYERLPECMTYGMSDWK